ncbi:coiled-coil domain-containing protein 112-like [Orussus abietinus]|uniref:coiled-coil domain-containing protein 112-like n=1 Tax=Orussus abietinus TaxID=222816 RepID=UPI000625B67D|nr:coiled-coil domain-containing protein 112-like [Orussus abietinus]
MSHGKSEFIKALVKLKQQELIIEKGISSSIGSIKIDSDILQSLVHYHEQLAAGRQKILDSVRRTTSEIVDELKSAKMVLSDPNEVQKLDVISYRIKLFKISKRIQEFKKSCPIDALEEQQLGLEADINEYSSAANKYDLKDPARRLLISKAYTRNKSNVKKYPDYHEIQDFTSLVAKTGHTQNWSDEDHLLFLKLRKKQNSVPALVAAIKQKCPDLTTECIVNHEAWYKLYLNLREKQKSAIEKWKRQKSTKKSQENNLKEREYEDISPDVKVNLKSESDKDEEEIEGDGVHRKTSVKDVKPKKVENMKQSKKESIKKWRLEKEKQRSADDERLRLLLTSRKTFEENQRQARVKRVRNILSEYKTRKSFEVALSNYEKNLEDMRKSVLQSEAAEMIKYFRQQDQEYLRKRRHQIMRSRNKNEANMSHSLPHKIEGSRDHSTLLNTTKVWEAKCKIYLPITKENRQVLYIGNLPKRSTNHWRNAETI